MSYSAVTQKFLIASYCFAIVTAIAAPISTFIASIASIAMLVTWVLSGHLWQGLKYSASHPAGKMILVFFIWLMISAFYADTAVQDKLITLYSWRPLFFSFLLLGMFYKVEWKKRLIYSYLVVMVIAALISPLLWILDFHVRGGLASGIVMTNHTSQSMAFFVGVLCCLFLWIQTIGLQKKSILAVIIILFVVNIFFVSASRSGYVALPVAVVFFLVNAYGFKKLPHILGGVVVVAVLIALSSNTLQERTKLALEEKTNAQINEQYSSIGVREIFRENALELILQRPILGYGTSSFKSTYSEHVAKKYQDWRGVASSDPHNQYLFVWLENGVIGLFLFLAYIFVAIKLGVQQKSYGLIAASVLTGYVVTSLFNSHFKTFAEGHLLAFFVGCLLSNLPIKKGCSECL